MSSINLFLKVQLSSFKKVCSICFNERLWHRGVVIITTAQLHSTKPELRFYAGSNPARGVLAIRDGEDL